MRQRFGYIDSLKGLAIILVVLGHLIQYQFCPNNYRENLIFNYIYSFHMGFFMLLSGYTVNIFYESWKEVLFQIYKRSVNLLLPFVCWGLFSWLIFGAPNLIDLFRNTERGLWFLHALFFIYVIFLSTIFPIRKKEKIIRYLWLLVACIIIRKMISEIDYAWSTVKIASHLANFILGYILADNKKWLLKHENTKWYYMTIPIFLILGYYSFSSDSQLPFWCHRFKSTLLFSPLVVLMASLPLFAIMISYTSYFKRIGLEKLGRITLGVYIIHQILIRCLDYLPTGVSVYLSDTIWGGDYVVRNWYGCFDCDCSVLGTF